MEEIEFYVSLIKCSDKQTERAKECLKDNCTYIDNGYYIFEGDMCVLDDDGVIYESAGCGEVPFLGDMDTEDLKKLCYDVFSVTI